MDDTPRMKLGDLKIRNASAGERPFKMADGGGLYLLVNPNGSKLWRLKYRFLGKEKTLAIGPYPEVSLAKARKARDAARELLAEQRDPGEERKARRKEALEERQRTFRQLAALYLERLRRDGRAETTIQKVEWLIGMAASEFGDAPVGNITAPMVLSPLRRLEANGTLETARRLKTTIGAVLRFGIAIGWVDSDPTQALHGAISPPRSKPHAAITDRVELGALLRAIEGFQGQPTTRIAMQLLALLHPRPGELRLARWEEFDLEKRVWTIPAARTKMRRDHRAPLPDSAVALLAQLKAITGFSGLLFPSIRSPKRPISDGTLTAALRRLGYRGDEMTAHGFRATFSTIANESGLWNPDAIERALAHVEKNAVRAAYARGEFWDERVRLADWWAETLQGLQHDSRIALQ